MAASNRAGKSRPAAHHVVALALACAGLPAPWAQRGIGALDNAAGTLYVAWPARATRDANASRQLSSALELKT